MKFLRKFLDRFPRVRLFVRRLRWQAKKIPLVREISMAFDKRYFSRLGAERPDEHEAGDGDSYFESYATVLTQKVYGRVLDIGCGHGYLTRRLAGNEKVTEIIGLDKINDFRSTNEKIHYQSQDLAKDQTLPSGFDVVVSSEFIEHITEEEYRRLLSRIVMALKPDGLYIGSTPHNPTPYKTFSGSRFHLREYSRKDLEAVLKEFFDQVKVEVASDYCLFWEARQPKVI